QITRPQLRVPTFRDPSASKQSFPAFADPRSVPLFRRRLLFHPGFQCSQWHANSASDPNRWQGSARHHLVGGCSPHADFCRDLLSPHEEFRFARGVISCNTHASVVRWRLQEYSMEMHSSKSARSRVLAGKASRFLSAFANARDSKLLDTQ